MTACVCLISFLGCGGDDSGQETTAGGDPAKKIAEENMKTAPPKNDPGSQNAGGQNTRNRAQNVGATSGGGASTAILD